MTVLVTVGKVSVVTLASVLQIVCIRLISLSHQLSNNTGFPFCCCCGCRLVPTIKGSIGEADAHQVHACMSTFEKHLEYGTAFTHVHSLMSI